MPNLQCELPNPMETGQKGYGGNSIVGKEYKLWIFRF